MKLLVREYVNSNSSSPYRTWLETVDISIKARVQVRVLRFEMGNLGDHKAVGGGVWEARLAFGPGYRVYFGRDGPAIVLLLLGGDKASQRRDIQRARLYWADYLEEKKHGKA